jgi:hypothetical protein
VTLVVCPQAVEETSMSLQVVVRRLALSVTGAALVAALGSLLHAQAVPPVPVNHPPAAPRSILVFPQRDFVSASGYEAGDLVTVEVFHPGSNAPASAATNVVPQDDPATPDFDGIVEVNHPGGACWETVTPDIRFGDRVRTTRRNSLGTVLGIDETTVANVTARRPVQTAFDTIEIHGTAQNPDGTPIDIAQLEQRLVAPRDAFDANGRRTLRATSVAGANDGVLVYDAVGGTAWTATYRGLDAADVTRALNAESRILWLGTNPGAVVENTIYEIGAGILPGPSAPCAAPLEKLPPPPGSELIAPSAPSGAVASLVGSNTVSLTWSASTDNVGVTSYGVYRNGVAIANVENPDGSAPAPTTYEDFNIPPGTYTYTIDAADAVGNRSPAVAASPAQISTTRQLAPDLPLCSGTPSAACVSEPPAATPVQVQIIAFPARDFTSSSGYTEQDASVVVQVIRNGLVISTATVIPQDDPTTAVFDGIVEVNHPGGGCWDGVTPDIRANDIVRQIAYAADGTTVRRIDQTHVANISVERPYIVHPATPGASDGVIAVRGTAMSADGSPINPGNITQRLVANRDAFDFNGRRTLRAGGAGKDGDLVYDATDNATGIKFTATYTGLDEDDVYRAVGGVAPTSGRNFPGAESRILWLDDPTAVAPGMTIYENSDLTISGPAAGACAAPIEALDTQAPLTPAPTTSQVGPTAVQLTWSPVSDDTYVNGYGIYRRDDDVAGADFVRIRNVGAALPPSATQFTFVDENVPVGNHTYAVDAVDSASPLKVNHPNAFQGSNTTDPILQGVEWGNRSALGTAFAGRQGDVLAPSTPANLVATVKVNPAPQPDQVMLTWSASSDNVGVTGYNVFRNGAQIATVTGAPPAAAFADTVTGVAGGTQTYTYTVSAGDGAGNVSPRSAPASATVTPKADTTAPDAVTTLVANTRDVYTGATAPAIGAHDVSLSWSATRDNVGVAGYGIYRRPAASLTPAAVPAFTKIADVNAATLAFVDRSVATGTYDYTIDAVDSAGNRSKTGTIATDVQTVDDPPQGKHSIIPFPQRDFVSSTGYAVSEGPIVITVIRGGKVWARSTPIAVVEDPATPGLGAAEVNHPGGGCWDTATLNGLAGITPDLRAGDIVRFTNAAGKADQTTTANLFVDRATDRALDGTPLAPGTIQTHGIAQDALGKPLPLDSVESRLVSSSADPFGVNGRRVLRAGGAGSDGTLTYDPVGPANPKGINWTATFTGLSQSDVDLATASESRVLWLGRDPVTLNEQTIFENGDGIAGGPAAGACTAPAEAGPAAWFDATGAVNASFDPFAQTLTFGSANTGSSTTQTLTLSNIGSIDTPRGIDGTLVIGSAGLDVGGDFQFANGCAASIAANAPACTLTVTFSPTGIGRRMARLILVDNSTNSPVQVIALSGDAIDASAPRVTAPVQTFAVGSALNLAAATVPVSVTATASDPSGVASMQLEQSVDAGRTWTPVSPAPSVALGVNATLTAALNLRMSSANQFRAKATDASVPGNASAPVTAPNYQLTTVDDNAQIGKGTLAPVYQGSWSTDKGAAGALNGTVHFATAPQPGKPNTVSLSFSGSEVAFVSTLGPDRGKATIAVDGGAPQTIDLYSASRRAATIVATAPGLGTGTHTVTISVLGTRNAASSGTRVDVDAFVLKF